MALFLCHKRILVRNFVGEVMKGRFMKNTLFFLLMALCPLIMAQEDLERPMVEYSPDFEFRDGLFANFESARSSRDTAIRLPWATT